MSLPTELRALAKRASEYDAAIANKAADALDAANAKLENGWRRVENLRRELDAANATIGALQVALGKNLSEIVRLDAENIGRFMKLDAETTRANALAVNVQQLTARVEALLSDRTAKDARIAELERDNKRALTSLQLALHQSHCPAGLDASALCECGP
jgi:chromosome segregation ATPase